MRVGLARVSTTKKAQDTSIKAQEQQLLNAGCDRVITVRESAYKGPRRGWNELRSLVASGTVTEVLCIDQSRLARDGSDLEFLEECAVRGVIVRALSGGVIETTTVGGFVQAGVFSVMNQAFSRQLGLKTKEGLDRRKADGHYGCGRVPYGYAYINGKVVPHPEEWPIARQMFLDLLAMEMNINGYCRKHRSKWTATGIRGWIVKPILRGIVANQEEGVKPLFSAAEWASASRLLSHRKRSSNSPTRTVHLLTGLVECQCCHKNLKYKTVVRGVQRLFCGNPACDWYGRGIRVPLIRHQLVEILRTTAQKMQAEVEQSTVTMDHQKTTAQVQVESKIATLEQLRQSSDLPGLDTAISALRRELTTLTEPLVGPDWSGLAELLATPGVIEAFKDAQLRALLLEYIAEIVYIGNPSKVYVRIREGS